MSQMTRERAPSLASSAVIHRWLGEPVKSTRSDADPERKPGNTNPRGLFREAHESEQSAARAQFPALWVLRPLRTMVHVVLAPAPVDPSLPPARAGGLWRVDGGLRPIIDRE
jgi:hypothetical protein